MKISEAMTLCDKLTGEACDSEMKLLWLDRIEAIIYREIISAHKGAGEAPAPCAEGERELSVPEPYSELYPLYMAMQNDMLLHDSTSYRNSAAAFGAAYSSFADMYNRTNSPVGASFIRL